MKPCVQTFCLLFLCLAVGDAQNTGAVNSKRIEDALRALCGNDADLRESAQFYFLSPENWKKLKYYSQPLLTCLQDYETSWKSGMILGQLDLPAHVRSGLLQSTNTPDFVRARLGDKEAQQRVVEKFQTAPFEQNSNHIAYLLYIGNREAIQTLAHELESEEWYSDPNSNKVSVASIVLATYGFVNQDLPLFSRSTLMQHRYTTEEEFREQKHQDYLRQIEKHFLDTYGIEIHMKCKFLIGGPRPVD